MYTDKNAPYSYIARSFNGMKFKELIKEQQGWWNNDAEINQKFWQVISSLQKDGCFFCEKKYQLFEELAFHIY